MNKYSYRARTASAEIVSGTLEAESRETAAKKLRSSGVYPFQLIQEEKVISGPVVRVGSKMVTAFTRNLADLVRSGFSITAALDALVQQEPNRQLKTLIGRLRADIQKGESFSSALSFHPLIFPSFYVAMVTIGETGGQLDQALERVAEFRERQEELVSSIRSALAYPLFLLSMGIVTVSALVVFFVPRLAGLFADFNQSLPLSTTIIMKTGALCGAYWWLGLLAFIALFTVARSWLRSEEHRLFMDALALRIPLAGALVQKLEVSRLSHALGVLLQNGIPMMQALSIAPLTVGNRLYRQSISSFGEMVRRGASLSACLKESRLFPPLFSSMTAVGEESGELSQMLRKAAHAYESELTRSLKTIVSLLEPVLVLIVGGTVVFIVFSILLPVFSLSLLSP